MNLLDDGVPSMLRDAARRALSESAPHDELTRGTETAATIAARHWTMAVELGWPVLLFRESDGGMELGHPELVELCEEMGANLFTGPWLASAVLVPCLRRAAQGTRTRIEWPTPGDAVALAVRLPDRATHGTSRYAGEHPELASHYVFVDTVGAGHIAIRIEPAAHVAMVSRPDGLDPGCPIAILEPARGDKSNRLNVSIMDESMMPFHLAIAAELNGIAAAALARAIAWVTERRQFSRSVGSFQAVKHRLANAFANFSAALTLARAAATSNSPHLAASARVVSADAARVACRDYVQLLGGAGISWEMDAHLYLKRTARLDALPPSTAALRRLVTDRYIERHASSSSNP